MISIIDFSSNRLAQCLCQQDFGGVQCEKSIRDVDHPYIGRFGSLTETGSSQLFNTFNEICINLNAYAGEGNLAFQLCDGLVYCSIQNLSKLFPETPCPVTSELYLQYRFSCVTRMQMKCPPHSLYLAGRCFTIDTKRIHLSHTKAKQVCRSQGGYLASNIEASMDSDLSRQLVRRGKEDEAFWIDLQVGPNGRLIWSDGNQVTYRPKSSTFMVPNSCVAYVISGGMADWTSLPCDASANYLCAFPPSIRNDLFVVIVTEDLQQQINVEKSLCHRRRVSEELPSKDFRCELFLHHFCEKTIEIIFFQLFLKNN
uniref:C-type lectin domain-containing protein n=1 Tax=Angiostrongylus cantonensis TaxID=6313 RepID=A0A0K0DQ96_ANGCA